MQNAAFDACGLDAVYLAFDVDGSDLGTAVAAIRALGFGGANVTIPHKRSVAPYLDELVGEAAVTGSVNTILNRNGRLVGHSTDGEGFVRSLREAGFSDLAGMEVWLLGTGGSALAIAARLREEPIGRLVVVTREKRARLDWPTEVPVAEVLTYEELADRPGAGCDLLVNTTPLGMFPRPEAMPPLPDSVFRPGVLVCDLIYNPPRTRLMEAAERAGATAINGLGMLVHQGAVAFEIWTGMPAPVGKMRAAAEAALDAQSF